MGYRREQEKRQIGPEISPVAAAWAQMCGCLDPASGAGVPDPARREAGDPPRNRVPAAIRRAPVHQRARHQHNRHLGSSALWDRNAVVLGSEDPWFAGFPGMGIRVAPKSSASAVCSSTSLGSQVLLHDRPTSSGTGLPASSRFSS